MISESHSMLVSVEIPRACGCPLKNSVAISITLPVNEPEMRHVIELAARVLPTWASDRIKFHRCELVSETNPSGHDAAAMRRAQMEIDNGA